MAQSTIETVAPRCVRWNDVLDALPATTREVDVFSLPGVETLDSAGGAPAGAGITIEDLARLLPAHRGLGQQPSQVRLFKERVR
jgi:hypothetical protein